ncbi:MAG: ATP-binding protein [Promethearchaeota archaeon]
MIESELYQTEKIFKEFLENISSGVVIYETTDGGKTFKIIEMNKAGLDSCKISRENIIGKNMIEVFPTIAEFGLVDLLRRVWKTGKPEHSPTSLYQDDRVSGWTEMYIYKLPSEKVVAIFEQQTKLIEAEENFKKKVEFEKKIVTISSRFVNTENLDKAINISLKEIGILSQSSRSYIFQFNDDGATMSNTHEWCNNGVTPQIEELQNLPMEMFPWSINKLKNDEILNIENIEDLPIEASAEKEEFMRETIKSLIFLPLKIGENISGFIGFDNVKTHEKWSEDDLNLLRITSDIIGNALKRNKTELELEKLNMELRKKYKKRSKQLEESEEKFRKLFENSPIAIMEQDYSETKKYIDHLKSSGVTDLNKFFDENPKEVIKLMTMNKVLDVNRKTLEIYNANNKEDFISRANHISDSIESNITDEVLSYNKNEFLSLLEGKTMYESEIASKTFTEDIIYLYARTSILPGFENNWSKIVVTLMDITERKIAEEKLRESEEKYRKAYFQANLYRDIFAHDINNILQNINSSVELSALYLNNPEKLSTIKELYDIVDEQVNRAKKLILNVRKITELDESEVKLEKIDVNRVLNNAIDFLKSSFQTRNINVQLDSPTKKNYVNANNLLLDVFENLLINAVRHNNKSKIEIDIDISKEKIDDKDYLKMEFKDNGVGISDYRKRSIFERGSRKSQKTKGMGLGLSLVKKIIDLYQGDIWVEDRVKGDYKQGSNFIVLIPTKS